jgi:hypothetical protein
MPEPLLSTRFKAPGPWLLDSAQLQRLEAVVDEFVQEQSIQAAALADTGMVAPRLEACSRYLTILLHGSELPAGSFKQAFWHTTSQNEVAVGFIYNFRFGDAQALVRVSADTNKEQQGSKDEAEVLEIRVVPQSSRISQGLFVALKAWAEEVGPSAYQRWLLSARGFARFFLAMMLIFGGLAFFSPTTDFKQFYKEEAHKILKEGVNQSNQQRAIELLLALQTDYSPPGLKRQQFGTVNPTFVVIAVTLAILAVTPRICLGFWKGKRRLQLYRWWMKAVPGTIPALIFARYVLPQLLTFAEGAFRR